MERARLWRYLSGDDRYDVDFYFTRLEQRARLLQQPPADEDRASP